MSYVYRETNRCNLSTINTCIFIFNTQKLNALLLHLDYTSITKLHVTLRDFHCTIIFQMFLTSGPCGHLDFTFTVYDSTLISIVGLSVCQQFGVITPAL